MDWVMARPAFSQLREALLQPASGEVLEIGFGTGLNLPHYPAALTRLSIADPAILLPAKVARRVAVAPYPIQIIHIPAENLPFPERQFDTVVSTWTLCTIPDPIRALQEIRRVLKPGGRFLFLEHGRSDDRKIAAWQDRLNPIQNVIGCGCNLNRQIDRLITQAGLKITLLDRFTMKGFPRLGGEMYRGTAIAAGYTGGRPLRSGTNPAMEKN
jgi:SAM-dependent methyltransferase